MDLVSSRGTMVRISALPKYAVLGAGIAGLLSFFVIFGMSIGWLVVAWDAVLSMVLLRLPAVLLVVLGGVGVARRSFGRSLAVAALFAGLLELAMWAILYGSFSSPDLFQRFGLALHLAAALLATFAAVFALIRPDRRGAAIPDGPTASETAGALASAGAPGAPPNQRSGLLRTAIGVVALAFCVLVLVAVMTGPGDQKAPASGPDAEKLTQLGIRHRDQNEPTEALELFDQALAADPAYAKALYNRTVVLHFDLGRTEEAKQALDKLLSLQRSGAEVPDLSDLQQVIGRASPKAALEQTPSSSSDLLPATGRESRIPECRMFVDRVSMDELRDRSDAKLREYHRIKDDLSRLGSQIRLTHELQLISAMMLAKHGEMQKALERLEKLLEGLEDASSSDVAAICGDTRENCFLVQAQLLRGTIHLLLSTQDSDSRRIHRAQAATWMKIAAENGHAEAACRLAAFYETGLGVQQNAAEARRWLRVARAGGAVVE